MSTDLQTEVPDPHPQQPKGAERPYVVGMGASAGGLEPLMQCVSNINPDLNCSYIVVQHMSASHRSMLAEILARDSQLPIHEIKDKECLLSRHVYTVPAGFNITVSEGRFHLHTPAPETAPKPSINLLFQSLAQEYEEHAIGIILSGTGTDGTAGLKAIKASGGLTFVQDPETAKYDGMPGSAIEADVVDRIIRPQQLGAELESLVRLEVIEDANAQKHDVLADLFERIYKQTRIDLSNYKLSTILRRLQRRLAATGTSGIEDYLKLVENQPKELDALAKEALISVTEFFRDKEPFGLLRRYVKDIVEQKNGQEIRVWVVGCATGEEAYSLAMLFAEELGEGFDKTHLQVFATDIDEQALSIARRGMYAKAGMSEVSPYYLAKYFRSRGNYYEPTKALRDCVVFARQDITRDPPFMHLDLVSCRNVLIYFNNDLQAQVLASMHYALREGGVLFLGRSENVFHHEDRFEALERRARIFRRTETDMPSKPGTVMRYSVGHMSKPKKLESSLENRFSDSLVNKFAPVAVLIDGNFNILKSHGRINDFLHFPSSIAEMNLIELIVPEFKSEIVTTVHRVRRNLESAHSRKRRITSLQKKTYRLSVHPLEAQYPSELFLVAFEPSHSKELHEDSLYSAHDRANEDELLATREHLQTLMEEMAASNEEMQALNEEVQASNEELQAANEELEAANEELQATNEELLSVNEERQIKVDELAAVNRDFENVYNTLDFPMLVVSSGLIVKRINSPAIRLYDLPATVMGKHISQLPLPGYLQGIDHIIESCLKEQRKKIHTLDHEGKTYQLFITPSSPSSGMQQSVVLLIIDNTELLQAQRETREGRERLLSIMNHSSQLISLKDTSGRYIFVNQAFENLFHVKSQQLLGKTDQQVFPASIAQRLRENDLEVMRKLDTHTMIDAFQLDGKNFWLAMTCFPILNHEGVVESTCLQAGDISETRQSEEQLRLAAKVFDKAGEAIVVTDAQGSVITVNPAFSEISGYPYDEVRGKQFDIFNPKCSSPEFVEYLMRHLVQFGYWQGEVQSQRKDQVSYPQWVSINTVDDKHGRIIHYVIMFSDISAIKASQERIEFMATHDELTGLPNRSLLLDRLRHGLAQAKRYKQRLALLFVDLDNFKKINDSLGHDVGDLLLKEAAVRLQNCVRGADTLARQGGDEFVALLEDVSPEQVHTVARRIVDYMAANFTINDKDLYISASIGISIFPDDGDDSLTLLKHADTAMYRAKDRGGNQYQFFADEMKVLALQRLTLETGLRQALESKNFRLDYQPQIDFESGEIMGAEALLRWHDPTLGQVSPARFIPVAESSGLMVPIGELVLELVLQQIKNWREVGLQVPRIAINISLQQLRSSQFIDVLTLLMHTYQITPEDISLELTESTLMDRDSIEPLLKQIEQQGLTISIDDFGTGYSSLSYLKRLRVHELKIDRSFIDGIADEKDDQAITNAIIQMAQAMSVGVIAEGVETEAQVKVLSHLGCKLGQGYYFHRPMPAEQFAGLLARASQA